LKIFKFHTKVEKFSKFMMDGIDERQVFNEPRHPAVPCRNNFRVNDEKLVRAIVKAVGIPDYVEAGQRFNKIKRRMWEGERNNRILRERDDSRLATDRRFAPFTQEEKDLLDRLVEQNGPNWKLMERSFNGRSDIQLKYQWLNQHLETRILQLQALLNRQPINGNAVQVQNLFQDPPNE
jgi:hypothetical protein